MSKSCLGCWQVDADCLVDVLSGRCSRCIEKNLMFSLLVTQGDCQSPLSLFRNVPNEFFSGDCVDKQRLTLQKELDKVCAENVELRAEKLSLMRSVLVSMRSVGLSYCVSFDCVNSWVSWVSWRRNCFFRSWRLLRSWKRRSRRRLGVL